MSIFIWAGVIYLVLVVLALVIIMPACIMAGRADRLTEVMHKAHNHALDA